MSYPLSADTFFTGYDDLKKEFYNFFKIRWETELGKTERIKFPNFPLSPVPTATESWIEPRLLFGSAKRTCLGTWLDTGKTRNELLFLCRISINTELNKGYGKDNSIKASIEEAFPSNFSLKSLKLQKGLSLSPKGDGREVDGFYQAVMDVPLECLILF